MKPILCLDFDGVLHSYTNGWMGANVVSDPPVPGALAFIKLAQEHFTVSIFSSRSNQSGGIEAMKAWLNEHMATIWNHEQIFAIMGDIQWPTEKPAAFLTIDDRALTFTGEWPDAKSLLDSKPWNKR
jgi:hypothetical protein